MILISAGLVVTAIVLLIAGFVLAKPFLVMWSIAVSVLSAVFLVIGALLRRHELFPGGGRAGAAPLPPKGPVPAGPMPAPHMRPDQRVPSAPHPRAPHGMPPAATVAPQPRPRPVAGPAPAARQGLLDAEAIVLVIPGRKRYHVAGCRQLVGRDHEELTHEEAREEGFTPCTTCLPEFTGGIQPQDAPTGAQEPVAHPAPSAEPGPSGDTRGPDVHEPTARFSPPYGPVTTATPQEAAAPVNRPYIQGPAAPREQARPQEPASPPLRAAETAARPFPIQSPEPEPETSADSEATSWFSRDMVASAASQPETRAEPEPSEPSAPSEPEDGTPAQPEPVTPTSTGAEAPAEAGGPAEPDPTGAETSIIPSRSLPSGGSAPSEAEESAESGGGSEPRGGTPAGSRPAGAGTPVGGETPAASSASDPEPSVSSEPDPEPSASSEPSKADPEPSGAEGTAVPGSPATSASAAQEAPEEPSPAERKAADRSASAEPDSPSEPVEPAGTAPGRAGRPVPADSTSAEPQVPAAGEKAPEAVPETAPEEASRADDGDTAPHGIPAVKDSPEPGLGGSGTVKVIVGTRRFHSSACPLIKGTDGSGIETMTRAEAEEAGLSSCSVCRDQG
ncbi:hypothetical protein [Streptosporangium roseum]|uniref:hypothetical protein n=1 Tax=Streptosporangium roseum TaxID=2001 RepID=UPI0033210319